MNDRICHQCCSRCGRSGNASPPERPLALHGFADDELPATNGGVGRVQAGPLWVAKEFNGPKEQ
jgi:hypothetical protein